MGQMCLGLKCAPALAHDDSQVAGSMHAPFRLHMESARYWGHGSERDQGDPGLLGAHALVREKLARDK